MENINDVAVCSTNRFSLEEEDVSTLTCDKFKDYGCMSKNDDLLPILTEREGGCGPATEMPTREPKIDSKAGKLLEPTFLPTFSPSVSPTVTPTFSPSFSPTLSPTLETEEPTFSPSLSPTVSPTFQPTLSPSKHTIETNFSTFCFQISHPYAPEI
eukprot:scaffold364725_cov89-Cyclotella_meneghiniana.AAC.1